MKTKNSLGQLKAPTGVRSMQMLADAVQPDGGLYSLGWYLAWTPGRESACLDGDFTANQLRAIADWIDSHQPPANTQPTDRP